MGRVCTTCLIEKDFEAFHLSRGSLHGRSRKCKSCTHQAQRVYRMQPHVKVAGAKATIKSKGIREDAFGAALVRHKTNMANIRHKYGLEERDLQDALLKQQGCCAICKTDLGDYVVNHEHRVYHIDHCHTTGQVRGLLCPACNTMLGCLEKHNVALSEIADYLSGKWSIK